MHLSRALDVLAPNNLKGDGWQSLIRLAWKVHINYQERNCAYCIPISIGIVSSGKILNAGRHARRSDVLGAEPEGHPGASNILYLPRRLN